jgi:quinol monooxygenase YgiN
VNQEDGVTAETHVSSGVRELAHYEVREEALERCLEAVRGFVEYVRANESGTLEYTVWQEEAHPTRFVHIFVFRDEEAHRIHSESAAVKRFAGILYPECLAPVEFTPYGLVATNL